MALRLRRNPAPSTGALFVSNPKRRKKRKASSVRKVKALRKNRRKPVQKKRKVVRKKRKASARKNRKVVAKRSIKRKVVRKNKAKKRVVRRKRRVVRKNKAIKRRVKRRSIVRRKNGTKKGMRRKTARRAYMKRRKNRRNPAKKSRIRVVRRNPMSGFAFLKPIEKLVSKIPVIGKKIAPATGVAVGTMVGGAACGVIMPQLGAVPYADKVFGHAFGYTVLGIGLAAVSAVLPLKKDTKVALAASFAAGGGAINAFQLAMNGFSLAAVAEANKLTMGVSEEAEMDLDVAGLGDGMYYEVAPLSGLAVDMNGMYHDAEYGDAAHAPADLDAHEGQAAMQGPQAYMATFGPPSVKAMGIQSGVSQHAGQHGHRWGWLIKSLGFQRFQALAKMAPQKRRRLIRQMKAAAMQAASSAYDQALTGAYQGLAVDMNGLAVDMSGLAVDNMAGLAIAGSGI
jgi:hypothetical protein